MKPRSRRTSAIDTTVLTPYDELARSSRSANKKFIEDRQGECKGQARTGVPTSADLWCKTA